jgi:hypothetical protein
MDDFPPIAQGLGLATPVPGDRNPAWRNPPELRHRAARSGSEKRPGTAW